MLAARLKHLEGWVGGEESRECCVVWSSGVQWLLALEEPAAALDGDSVSTLSQHQGRYRPQLEFAEK